MVETADNNDVCQNLETKIKKKMSKQTAVQWLIQQISTPEWKALHKDGVFDKVIEIEKQQIKDAYNSERDLLSRIEDSSAAEEYYKETYG